MPSQETISAGADVSLPKTSDVRAITIPVDFRMRPVDGEILAPAKVFSQQVPNGAKAPPAPPVQPAADQEEPRIETEIFTEPGSHGVLERFVGKFEGNGFNTIFRPKSFFKTGQTIKPELETTLELNLTWETLTFMDKTILGDIPNRGFDDQGNVMLKGIPYTQMVGDLLNEKTGKADRKKPGISIHFEQGLFLRTPKTQNPNVPATIARLASIPHGSTINAQCVEPPTAPVANAPVIPSVSIKPFGIGSGARIDFFDNPVLRVPGGEVLKNFQKEKTLIDDQHKNPNSVLSKANEVRNIVSHHTFEVTTNQQSVPGGGTSNIAFLVGQKPNRPGEVGNAIAKKVSCKYWVSTVKSEIVIPAGDYAKTPQTLTLLPEESKKGITVPFFDISLNRKVSADTSISVFWTQIQYSQDVTLDFGTLSWPHISVATLIPATSNTDEGRKEKPPLKIPADSPLLSQLK